MRAQNMSLALEAQDACPVCGAIIKLAEVQPHPIRIGLEILGFHCEACGPVKSLVVARRMNSKTPLC